MTAIPAPGWRALSVLRLAASALALVASVAPPLWWLAFIVRKSPNVPFTDEWTWAPVSYAARNGRVPWALLWEPHNGHREFVDGLVFLALDRFAGWSVPREELVCLLLGTCALVLVFETLRRVLDLRDALVLTALASLLLCGPLAYETILIGYNLGWQICTLALAYVVWAFVTRRISSPTVGAAALVAAIATFSSGQGLFLWPVGVLLLVSRGARFTAHAVWIACGAVCTAIYLAGLTGVTHGAAPAGETLRYLTVFLGTPLAWDGTSLTKPALGGALLLAAFVALTAWAARGPGRAQAAPLVAYGLYALFGALSTTATRAPFGVLQATSPRYSAMAVFLLIAVLGEVYLLAQAAGPRGAVASVFVSLAALAAIGHVQNVMAGAANRYTAERVRELRGLAREDPAAPADTDPVNLLGWLSELRETGDGPIRYR